MAITPEQVAEKRKAKAVRKHFVLMGRDLEKVEAHIDKRLIGFNSRIDVGKMWRECGIEVVAEDQAYDYIAQIIKLYEEVGWTVQVEHTKVYGVECAALLFSLAKGT